RGGPVWTDPYIFFTSRQPGVTAASPIYTKAGSLAGVIGVDVEIGAIGEFLNGLALGRNGSAFILSADGEVLAVPGVSMPTRPEGTGDKLRFTRVEELEDPVAKAAAATLWALPPGRSGQAVAAATPRIELDAPRFTTFSYQARDWHAVFAPFGDARWPWIIGIYMPEDDFLVELKRNQLHNVYLAAVIGALACIAGLLFAGSLGRTMAQLRERALAIGHGRLDGDMGIASPYREVQEMTTAFAGMVTALRDHRRQNALLATVMEQAPDATALTDPQLRVSYVNPAFEAATGRRAPACYGRTVFELARPVEPDALPVEDIRAEIAAGRSWHGEFVGRRIDDRSWSIAVGVTPVQDDDGTVTHCLVVLRDISDQKRAEAALVGARDAAILANRAKSDFLANVSHELRTPLNAVIGFSEVLKNELFGPLGDARYREYAGYIYDGGTDLLSLLNDVLDMARVETGRIELMEERFDLERAIRRCGVMVQERARSKNLDLRFGEGLSGVAIQGDERLFRQIVMNLLTNAVKFTPAGGRIRVDAAWPAEGGLLLTVADTGIGIPADALSKVMEPFMRVETALSQDYEGVGLGLPLSRAFAELHGGSLTLESQVGQGTRVTLRLPPERVLRGAA
ncbi:MAG: ATP-binding protein, partial [Alphaproteobacteria bacterium]